MENLKLALAFPLSLAMAYDEAKADGELTYMDLRLVLDPAMKAFPAIQALPEAWEELKQISDENRAQLHVWVKAEFDIADDELEERIENGLALMADLARYVAGWVPEKLEAN
jgi:hypothetical protein